MVESTVSPAASEDAAIEVFASEQRVFAPPAEFVGQARFSDPAIYEQAAADPEGYWKGWAEQLEWIEPFTQVLDWSDAPFAKWFADGKLNVSANCLDRHVAAGRGTKVAYHWEGEDGA